MLGAYEYQQVLPGVLTIPGADRKTIYIYVYIHIHIYRYLHSRGMKASTERFVTNFVIAEIDGHVINS